MLAITNCLNHHIFNSLNTWGISYDIETDIEYLLSLISNSSGISHYDAILVDHDAISVIEFNQDIYTKIVKSLPTILFNRPNNHTLVNDVEYSFTLDNTSDDASLFNALHAISISKENTHTPIDFDKYARQQLDNKLNILIAEDNATNQLVIRKIMERANYTPHIVGNGQEALDALKKNKFDLIILDMQMPVMGGIEAAKTYN